MCASFPGVWVTCDLLGRHVAGGSDHRRRPRRRIQKVLLLALGRLLHMKLLAVVVKDASELEPCDVS